MKKENKKQVVVFHLMGKSVENKALSSAGCPIRSGMTECAETGRSMVEMLGVLAIMGVLSVGGVSMYSSAMSKHRANELLNEASKRAAIVARQITAGKTGTDLSIDKFTNPTGYKFYVDKTYTAGGKTFKLTLSKDPSGAIDENICTQMKAALGDNAAMAIDDTCATITFNADMGKDVKMPGVSTPDGYTGDDGSDCSGDTKLGTANSCQVCVNGAYIDSDAKCDKDKNQVCLDGVCTTPTDNGRTGCTRNSDCKGMQNGIDCNSKTCYCNYYNYRTGRMRDGSCTGGATKGSGVCMEAIFEETTVDDDGIKGKLSTEYMDWFSAKNFCAALGGSMISLKGSGINKSGLGSYFEEHGYCYGSDDEKCEGVDWSVYKGKLASTYWWTKDLTTDSCYPFAVNTGGSYVNGYLRNYGYHLYGHYSALCK